MENHTRRRDGVSPQCPGLVFMLALSCLSRCVHRTDSVSWEGVVGWVKSEQVLHLCNVVLCPLQDRVHVVIAILKQNILREVRPVWPHSLHHNQCPFQNLHGILECLGTWIEIIGAMHTLLPPPFPPPPPPPTPASPPTHTHTHTHTHPYSISQSPF